MIVFGPTELVFRGSVGLQVAIPEPESAQIAWATCPKPYVGLTVTVGCETSIGTASEPCEPSLPWKSREWTPVPLMGAVTGGGAASVNGAPSRLYLIPGAPLIVTTAAVVYHPLGWRVPLVTSAWMSPVGSTGVTDSPTDLLLVTATLPDGVDRLDEPLDRGADERAGAAPPSEPCDISMLFQDRARIPVEGDDSLDACAPPALSSTSTANATVLARLRHLDGAEGGRSEVGDRRGRV